MPTDSDLSFDSSLSSIPADLPSYCEFYKFFLVEELVLEKDYRKLHYGNCSLIGKIRETEDGLFELENIKLPNIPREYSLPEGTVSLRLLTFNYWGTKLQHGRFCEVCGEVVLLNRANPVANHVPITACDVNRRFAQTPNEQEGAALLAHYSRTHRPAVKILYLNEVDRAGELAERNLELRLIGGRAVR